MADDLQTRLADNVNAVTTDPSTPLDKRVFEEAELVLVETLSAEQRQSLTIGLSTILPTLQQDPTPVVNLLLRLVRDLSYSDVLQLGSVPFTDGLVAGEHMVSFNRLIIALLQKATRNAADAASVAGMLDTVLALVRLWLSTSDTGVASQSGKLLLDLLKVDQDILTDPDAHLPSGGQGLVWKRIFGDRDVYRTFFEVCSLTGPTSLKLSKSQRTLAQARLMEWLPQVGAMDWSAISRSHHSDVESEYSVQSGGGLLDFAALHMVDIKDDVLLHLSLLNFYSNILRYSPVPSSPSSISTTDSPGLLYLIKHGLHTRTAGLYLQLPGAELDPVDAMFLYGPAANYIATYAEHFPQHFLASQMPPQVLTRLSTSFDLSPGKWAHAESPKHDLHLISSLPRRALVPSTPTSFPASPLSLLPTKATNPDVLNTLATIFHGPTKPEIVFGGSSTSATPADITHDEEANHARTLYYNYLARNPRMWTDITTHADTVALKDLALAALHLTTSVITANWSESANSSALPTTIATPPSGHIALLSPPALEYVLPYLLKPAQSFSNLVGGRGDAESAAYRIAAAKFDAVTLFARKLKEQVDAQPGEGYEEILATVSRRLQEGPLSREAEVGGRIATMEL
ncbi:unnamed protein product [Zymoseptoria tritici ST99CH_1A5]|uniref:DNA mismatch repair protein HSM3 N-terminal domain-containing protein n=1 Tax=Zymoseptoria tritici ST99CH_1A5 TaxID=1276529 RepID=A0A1Y6LFH3_ZYMTR|nr:unnamed protein product [Zymoseptoria tritici ST99CH_1A5]